VYNKYVTHPNDIFFIIKAYMLELSEFVLHVSIQLYYSSMSRNKFSSYIPLF